MTLDKCGQTCVDTVQEKCVSENPTPVLAEDCQKNCDELLKVSESDFAAETRGKLSANDVLREKSCVNYFKPLEKKATLDNRNAMLIAGVAFLVALPFSVVPALAVSASVYFALRY